MRETGFEGIEPAGETGFNSSPITRGALFRAMKGGGKAVNVDEGLKKYREFFDIAYADGLLDKKTKILIALGASLGAGCEA